jgi:hypothetical protein
MLSSIQAFRICETQAQWRLICKTNPVVAQWTTSDPLALAFFRYADFLLGYLSELLPARTTVRLVVDSLDWLTGRGSVLESAGPGLTVLGSGEPGIQFEALAISDKRGSAAATYLPLLGLVDSEAWAFGRFQSLRFEDGTTVRQRSLVARDAGSDPNYPLFSVAEFNALVAPHANHENLLHYWQLCCEWDTSGRAICLGETESVSMQRGRQLNLMSNR